MKYNNWYYLQFNGRFYLVQYKGTSSLLGHNFKFPNSEDSIFVGQNKLVETNPVLWKVK